MRCCARRSSPAAARDGDAIVRRGLRRGSCRGPPRSLHEARCGGHTPRLRLVHRQRPVDPAGGRDTASTTNRTSIAELGGPGPVYLVSPAVRSGRSGHGQAHGPARAHAGLSHSADVLAGHVAARAQRVCSRRGSASTQDQRRPPLRPHRRAPPTAPAPAAEPVAPPPSASRCVSVQVPRAPSSPARRTRRTFSIRSTCVRRLPHLRVRAI